MLEITKTSYRDILQRKKRKLFERNSNEMEKHYGEKNDFPQFLEF